MFQELFWIWEGGVLEEDKQSSTWHRAQLSAAAATSGMSLKTEQDKIRVHGKPAWHQDLSLYLPK